MSSSYISSFVTRYQSNLPEGWFFFSFSFHEVLLMLSKKCKGSLNLNQMHVNLDNRPVIRLILNTSNCSYLGFTVPHEHMGFTVLHELSGNPAPCTVGKWILQVQCSVHYHTTQLMLSSCSYEQQKILVLP